MKKKSFLILYTCVCGFFFVSLHIICEESASLHQKKNHHEGKEGIIHQPGDNPVCSR